jgi:hypothetical protein
MSNIHTHPGAVLKGLADITVGLTNNPPPGLTQLAAGGKVSTIADLLVELLQYHAAYKAADDATNARDKAILTRDKAAPTAISRLEEVQGALKTALGKRNPDLLLYGIKPNQKPTPPTVAQQTVRVAKAKATRIARHTLGSKQKKAIKGKVPAAEELPPLSAPTPPAPEQPPSPAAP